MRRWGRVEELANPRHLLLDYDRAKTPSLRDVYRVARIAGFGVEWVRHDRTRRGWHVVIRTDRKLLPAEQVALQAILGSDPRRELLNIMRVIAIRRRDPGVEWRGRWNILFSGKLKEDR